MFESRFLGVEKEIMLCLRYGTLKIFRLLGLLRNVHIHSAYHKLCEG